MGLSVSRPAQRQVADDLCRPCGLYPTKSDHIDFKTLRSLVRSGRIAPFYRGTEDDDGGCDVSRTDGSMQLEECAICMLLYPALNSSSCCTQRLCSDCFVQIQTTAAQPGRAPCPFCKSGTFAVRFLGAKSDADWERDRREEQRVVEARKREHQAQIVQEQQRMLDRFQQQRHAATSAHTTHMPTSSTSSGSSSRSNSHTAARSPRVQRASASWSSGWQQVAPDVSREAVDGASVTHHLQEPNPPIQPPQNTTSNNINALRRLMAADFIPASMVEMHGAVTLDDLNQLMLEQALMASLAADANSASNSTDAPAQGPHTAVQAAPRQGVPTVA